MSGTVSTPEVQIALTTAAGILERNDFGNVAAVLRLHKKDLANLTRSDDLGLREATRVLTELDVLTDDLNEDRFDLGPVSVTLFEKVRDISDDLRSALASSESLDGERDGTDEVQGRSAPEASEAAADKPEARVAATGVDDYWRNKIADTEQVFMALMDSVGDVTVDVTATGQKALDAFLEAEAKAWKFLYGSRPNPRTATRAEGQKDTPATPGGSAADAINQNPRPEPTDDGVGGGVVERLAEILSAGHTAAYDLRGDIAAEFDIPTTGPENIVAATRANPTEGNDHDAGASEAAPDKPCPTCGDSKRVICPMCKEFGASECDCASGMIACPDCSGEPEPDSESPQVEFVDHDPICQTCGEYDRDCGGHSRPDGWQPIETAPKDGRTILISDSRLGRWRATCANFLEGRWLAHDGGEARPTGWAPVPEGFDPDPISQEEA